MARTNFSCKERGRTICLAAACAVALLLSGCAGHETDAQPGTQTALEDMPAKIRRVIGETDLSEAESTIDTSRFDAQTDRTYKAAFFRAVTNQIPIQRRQSKDLTQEGTFYYKALLQNAETLNEEELLQYIRQSDFYYQDFDGDGLPELTVNTEGPCVLKYDPETDTVELYYRKGRGWNLLGVGQMYYIGDIYYDDRAEDSGDSDRERFNEREYIYESVEHGMAARKLVFRDLLSKDRWLGWVDTYTVSADGSMEIEVDAEEWREMIPGFYEAISLAPHPMSFTHMFGDLENETGTPGIDPEPRYMLEDRQPLPVNEKTGEEWEAYQAMMKGDYSLVEEESWVILQDHYESSLEDGNGSCGWSYFLMDFNQDGRKELCIRFNRREYNDTAFFRYENGHIKMWGSFNSADSHGFEIPLMNGNIIGVYWYQNDKMQWVNRLDTDFHYIDRRCYEADDIKEDQDYSHLDKTKITEDGMCYFYQDYYHDGQTCGSRIQLTESEWDQIQEMLEGLFIPEEVWQPCSEFKPMTNRPEIPAV